MSDAPPPPSPPAPSRVRYHSIPAQLDAGGVMRTTGLNPAELAELERYVEARFGGKRYT